MSMPRSAIHRDRKIYHLTMTAVMAAVTCVLAPIALPIGPIPVTLCTLVIYLSQYLLGWKRGALSCLVYLLLGFMGAPVFAGFTGGVGKLLGPTGGYIVGYLAVSVVSGLAVEKFRSRFVHLFGMVLGTAICYGIGTVWYCFITRVGVSSAVTLCVLPFIPGDLVKMVVSLTFGPALRSRLEKAGLLKI